MAKPILNEMSKLTLRNLATDDYQHGEHYSGEPISIKLSETPDLLSLIFFFENTDEDVAEDWVSDFLTSNGFTIDSYEMYGEGDEHSIVAACFSLTAVGADQDYEFTPEELASISPSKHISEAPKLDPQASIITNNINVLTGQQNLSMDVLKASGTKSKKTAFKKTTTKTVLPATAASKQIVANLGSSGQSLKGKSNRVSTLDANGNKVSAAKQIQAFIDQVLPILNANDMTILTDTCQCKKLASLGFPLFMQVNHNLDYKTQAQVQGKYRYGKKVTNILGIDYYTTNHLFQRNIEKVKQMFIGMGLLDQNGLANPNRLINTSIQASNESIQEFPQESIPNQQINESNINAPKSDETIIDKKEDISNQIEETSVDISTKLISEADFFKQSENLINQSTKQVTNDIVNSIENNWDLENNSSSNSENSIKNEQKDIDVNIDISNEDSSESIKVN